MKDLPNNVIFLISDPNVSDSAVDVTRLAVAKFGGPYKNSLFPIRHIQAPFECALMCRIRHIQTELIIIALYKGAYYNHRNTSL